MVDLGLAQKVRPALVVSAPYGDNDRALLTIVPHTTALRQSDFEVPLQVRFLKPGAFMVQGITAIDPSQATRIMGTISQEQLAAVESKIRLWLQLPGISQNPSQGKTSAS
jgi:mRNA interferase MazF